MIRRLLIKLVYFRLQWAACYYQALAFFGPAYLPSSSLTSLALLLALFGSLLIPSWCCGSLLTCLLVAQIDSCDLLSLDQLRRLLRPSARCWTWLLELLTCFFLYFTLGVIKDHTRLKKIPYTESNPGANTLRDASNVLTQVCVQTVTDRATEVIQKWLTTLYSTCDYN